MDMNKARIIIETAAGMPWRDWCAVMEIVSRKYSTARDAVVFTDQDAAAALRTLEAELPRGE